MALLPGFLENDFLKKYGFPKSVLRQWKEEGFLDCDSDHKTKLISTETHKGLKCSSVLNYELKKKTRFYCIPWEIFNDK